ncbi:MAG: DUF2807 domain-containing protein [Hyphomonadaceae bacterium]
MRLAVSFAAAAFALSAAASATAQTGAAQSWTRHAAEEVRLRDVAGFVVVTPEDRSDIAMSVVNPGPLPAPETRITRNRLEVDGKLRRDIRSCRVRENNGFEVELRRQGRLNASRLPTIYLRVPRNADVTAGGAVRVHMGPTESLRFRIDGCGDADIERVAGAAEIAVAGAPDVRLYEADRATISVAGAGDVTAGAIRSGLTVSIAGAGDFVAAHADGPTSIAVQGAGDVVIREGTASTLSVAIAGSGDVTHNGAAGRLDAAIVGAGDVRVAQVTGPVTRRILGSGDVIVGR